MVNVAPQILGEGVQVLQRTWTDIEGEPGIWGQFFFEKQPEEKMRFGLDMTASSMNDACSRTGNGSSRYLGGWSLKDEHSWLLCLSYCSKVSYYWRLPQERRMTRYAFMSFNSYYLGTRSSEGCAIATDELFLRKKVPDVLAQKVRVQLDTRPLA